MVVYDKIFSVVQDSLMRSLCNNMVVLCDDRITIKSIMHSAATVHYEEVQDFRVYSIVQLQLHGCCTAIVSQDLQRSARFSYTSHCATWLLYGTRISKYLRCRAWSSNTFQLCNMFAVLLSCHKIFDVLQYVSLCNNMAAARCSYRKNTFNAVQDSRIHYIPATWVPNVPPLLCFTRTSAQTPLLYFISMFAQKR